MLDLLAVDYPGRLAVVELKASADIQLPLQALDYWIRVAWRLDRGAPRLLLVSPSLEFHPTTETILSYFAPRIEGDGPAWR
jgi:hypothetical protein